MLKTQNSDIFLRLENSGAKTVALQFPEGIKREAISFAEELRKKGYIVIISGEPCWGACDLDLDILKSADVLVHYGHAPVDDTKNIIYEFLRHDIDINSLEPVLGSIKGKKIGLVTTIQHVHELERIKVFFAEKGIECIVSKGGKRTPYKGQVLGCSFEAAKNTGCNEILFVGTGVFHPLGVSLATGARVIAFDPYMKEVRIADPDRLLRQRFAKIEKARSAGSFGIILSKKSGQKREELAERLASLSDKACIISIGEVTPDALLNLGFDAYVNTACPRLAYDDQARFPRPMLSPAEFEIVCKVRDWEDYKIDEIN
ncbi:2-(3-amino-3-carboxypropyl)histidine synthase [Methanomicrobium sp. W14]|uniref:diphthamide biosynthesis enzyme Dph2 n=1 Tax=Methanomicrobium sp. W14 TaxID=2817839 RepID=UPI001AEB9BEF|nr:diphthamide biosynthesis enzyme Dph2 [Methanomicrobium sp. W14]MBP2133637.1 2-(3-amino-3-carboxypropyl)histidine synthase [Methanomicrobium sp. W14]